MKVNRHNGPSILAGKHWGDDIGVGPFGIVVVFVAGMAVLGLLIWGGVINGNTAQNNTVCRTGYTLIGNSCVQNNPGGGGLTGTTLPLSISNTDPLARSLITTTGLVSFYTPGGSFLGGCTISSGTCTTTGTSFTSGTNVVAFLNTTGYVLSWYPLTIPSVPSGASAITSIPLSLYQLKNDSWGISGTIGTTQFGKDASSSAHKYQYNYTLPSTAAQNIAVSLGYVTPNAGYVSCSESAPGIAAQTSGFQYDIIDHICNTAVFQITDSSTGLSVVGMPRAYSSGSVRYWWAIVPDGVGQTFTSNGGMGQFSQVKFPGSGPEVSTSDSNTGGSLTQQTSGQTLYGGTATINFVVKQGSLATSNNETLVLNLYVNANPNNFPANNNLGPYAVNATEPFSIVFTGS